MSKKVLVISTSPRKGGNSDALAEEFAYGGQMKTMLDRANPLYSADYQFRDVYMLTAAAEEGADTPEYAMHGLEGWIRCFPKARLAGTVFGGGADAIGDIKGNPALLEAFDMGKTV